MKRRPPKGYATWSEYNRYRVERGVARGLSRSQALGHPAKGEQLASKVEKDVTLLGKGGPVVVTLVGTKARSQAGSFDNDARLLRDGKLSRATFDHRWKGKSIGGIALPSSGEVLALAHRGRIDFDDFYPKGTS